MTHVDIISFVDRRCLDEHLQRLVRGEHVLPDGVTLFAAFVERAFKTASTRPDTAPASTQAGKRQQVSGLQLENVDMDMDVSSDDEDTDTDMTVEAIDAKDDLGSCSSMFVDLAVKVMVTLCLRLAAWDACMRVHKAALTQRLLELLQQARRGVASPPWLGLGYADLLFYVLREASSSSVSVRQALASVHDHIDLTQRPDTKASADLHAVAAAYLLTNREPKRALKYAETALACLRENREAPPNAERTRQAPFRSSRLVVAEGKLRQRLSCRRPDDAYTKQLLEALLQACERASGPPLLERVLQSEDPVAMLLRDSLASPRPTLPRCVRRRVAAAARQRPDQHLARLLDAANLIHTAVLPSTGQTKPSRYDIDASGVSTDVLLRMCSQTVQMATSCGAGAARKELLGWVRHVYVDFVDDKDAGEAMLRQHNLLGDSEESEEEEEEEVVVETDGLGWAKSALLVGNLAEAAEPDEAVAASATRLVESVHDDEAEAVAAFVDAVWTLPRRMHHLVRVGRRLMEARRGSALQQLSHRVHTLVSQEGADEAVQRWAKAAYDAVSLRNTLVKLTEADDTFGTAVAAVVVAALDEGVGDGDGARYMKEQSTEVLQDTCVSLLARHCADSCLLMACLLISVVSALQTASKAKTPRLLPKAVSPLHAAITADKALGERLAALCSKAAQKRLLGALFYVLHTATTTTTTTTTGPWLQRRCRLSTPPLPWTLRALGCVYWWQGRARPAARYLLQAIRCHMNAAAAGDALVQLKAALEDADLLYCLCSSLGSPDCHAYLEAAILCQMASPPRLDDAFALLQTGGSGRLDPALFVYVWQPPLIELLCSLSGGDERRRKAALKQLHNPMLRLPPDSPQYKAHRRRLQQAFIGHLIADERFL